MDENNTSYPEGHFIGMWMGIGIAIFSGLGIPLSIITDNPGLIGIGPAIGVGFGISIGQIIENKYKKEGKIRPKNRAEQKKKNNAILMGILLLIFGIILALLVYFL